ncbi:1218_t:CDS:2 [Gigaspora margarita]|uniref:1218_t:CDS:1 n=1 Tax=Gigaspora margarita TaxID=4874 RepID=A0ABN7URS1_GIGMA|nr:1218_t:CDS:2 [Gigaspora margarita]
MYKVKPHKYFDRDSSNWNILDFLNACDVEPFDNKIDVYLKSLENIFDQEEDTRREKARALLDQYRTASNIFFLCDMTKAFWGSDRTLAKKWNKTRKLHYSSGTTININHSVSATNGTIHGTINNNSMSGKRDHKDEIDQFFQSPNDQQPNQFNKKLRKLEATDECINDDDDEIDKEMCESSMLEFEHTFQEMRKEKKWFLKSGKCVEDELYAFGKQCRFEHLAHSFIIDPDDETCYQNNVFTSEELEEIHDTESKDFPKMPTELLKFISSFRMKTTENLRIRYSLLLEYESGTLKQNHLEAWYNIHIWPLIDRSFNELKGVNVARGESCSLASAKRKNKYRVIQGLVATTRKALGRRGDLILRKGIYEYGASEIGKDYKGDKGTKLLRERGLKSLKMLKDMLVDLGNYIKWEKNKLRQLELVSFIHARSLFMLLLRIDAPAGYMCRITRSETLQIPTDVRCFEEALKCMVLTWKAKNLQEAGAHKHKDCTIVPNCVSTPQKKRKVPQTSQVLLKKKKE